MVEEAKIASQVMADDEAKKMMQMEDEILSQTPSDLMLNEREVVRRTGIQSIKDFLETNNLYDVIRDSGKVVVFDTNIPIQLAFYALLEHDLSAAPIWDSVNRIFVGLLSTTDFIDILRHYHRRGVPMDELSSRTISQVMMDTDGRSLQHSHFLGTPVDTQVLHACKMLHGNNQRYLPVLAQESMGIVSILSYFDVLKFLVSGFKEQRRLFEDTLLSLGIGCYGADVVTVSTNARLVDVLDIMEKKDISAIPVVDSEGQIISIYRRSDITFLATATDAENVISNLEMTLGNVLEMRQTQGDLQAAFGGKDRLHTCTVDTTLQEIFELFAEIRFHYVVCIDSERRCTGVITPRDLVVYFLKE